jgi:peptidyl-prolyl cis-trans isomerase SurA
MNVLTIFGRTATPLFCIALLISSHGQDATPNKKSKSQTLFTVNKDPVSVDEFIYLYKKNHQDKSKDFTAEKINEYLGLFINFKLKVTEAKNRGLDTTAAFQKEYDGYKEELRKPYLPDAKIIDSLVRLTYQRMQEEVSASHLLVSLKPEATPDDTLKAYNKITELRNKILNGQDFGQVAMESSDDPSARTNKGNLGYFTAMQMVYPFESAAYSTSVGAVSQPVRTRFGYHILKVLDRRPARGEVEVSHILIRTGSSKETDQVKNTIFNIYDQLQAGVSWDELCRQYSEDPNTKEKGGRLKPFGAGAMSAIPEFEKVAFELQKTGDISDPFLTRYGWHIMRLERKVPVPAFEDIEATLKAKVARDERTELSKKELQEKLRREYQYQEHANVKGKLIGIADSTLQKAKWNPSRFPIDKREALFLLQGKEVTVQSFLDYIKKHQRPTVLAPAKYMEQLYNQFVDNSIMALVEQRIAAQHPEYRFLLREYYEGILLFDIMEKEVWSKASGDSVGQRSFYASHKGDYVTGERAQVTLYSSNSEDFTESLKGLILDSATKKVEAFASQYKLKTESGYFTREERAVLRKVPWAKGVYSAENNGMYYLAWLKDILPAGPMSFEEARPSIISDYQGFLEKNWVEQLKKKYPVKVNEKGKQYILQQLQIP